METGRMQTPLRRVRHLGSAHEGTLHFWRQRLTAVANVPLVVGFIVLMICLAGRQHQEVAAALGSPLIAAMLLLLIASVTIHMRIGVQVVIEDYVHNEGLKLGLLAANTFFAVVIAVASGLAILKLALGG